MFYQGNALKKKRQSHFWIGFACVLIVLLACVIAAWGHDTPAIRNGDQTHTLTRVRSDDRHWHKDSDGRGSSGWKKCVADAYDEATDSYDLQDGRCAEPVPEPEPKPEPPPPQASEIEGEQVSEETPRQELERSPVKPTQTKAPEVVIEPEPVPEPKVPTGFYEFDLELNAGWNLVHIPLELLSIDNEVVANETIGELFQALGVDTMFYHDAGSWLLADENTAVSRNIYQGFTIYAEAPVTKILLGLPLSGNLVLQEGMNFVGLPSQFAQLQRVSDLLSFYPGVIAILVEDEGTLNLVVQAGDPGDIPITGGQAFGIISNQNYFTGFHGEPWGREIYE